jgi:DNA-binding NtrC family response regulator
MFLLDADSRLIDVNPAWESLFEISADQIIGAQCVPNARGHEPGPLAVAAAHAPPPRVFQGAEARESVAFAIEGDVKTHEIAFMPLRDHLGQVSIILGVVASAPSRESTNPPKHPTLAAQLLETRVRWRDRLAATVLVGRGPAFQRLRNQIEAATRLRSNTLLVGEPGVGKRTAARVIAARASNPAETSIVLDAALMSASNIDEIATRQLSTEGGKSGPTTLVIQNVDALSRDVQHQLVEKHAGTQLRLITTTTRKPDPDRNDERYRDDFYFWLTEFTIEMPPLRERVGNVPILAQHFMESLNPGSTRPHFGFAPETIDALESYDWPGNIAELKRVVEAACDRAKGPEIRVQDLPFEFRSAITGEAIPTPKTPDAPLDVTLERVERAVIERAIQIARGNKSRAAELLAISRPRLHRRMKELGFNDDPREADAGSEPGAGAAPA